MVLKPEAACTIFFRVYLGMQLVRVFAVPEALQTRYFDPEECRDLPDPSLSSAQPHTPATVPRYFPSEQVVSCSKSIIRTDSLRVRVRLPLEVLPSNEIPRKFKTSSTATLKRVIQGL